jgi:GMP synthase-like glutamine amidotransferase
MKLALLLADHVPKYRYSVSGGNYPEMFANLFLKINEVIDMDVYDVTLGEYPDMTSSYSGYIISGSRASAYDTADWIRKLKEYICGLKVVGHKIIGICFGHQLIAQALGGQVERAHHKGLGAGIKTIKVLKRLPFMDPYEEYLSLLFYHYDQVTRLPKGAEVIAYNDFCEVQMYHINMQVLGIQAHPEMLRSHNHLLITEAQGSAEYSMAIDTLRMRDHSMVVAMWIIGFLGYE